MIDAVLADWTTAPLTERQRAALRLLETFTTRPQDIDAAFIAALGLDTAAIEAVTNVGFHFNFINRLADAFDFPILDDAQRRRTAKMLDTGLGGAAPLTPSFVRGVDEEAGIVRAAEIELGRNTLLDGPGTTPPALRRAVEARAASWFGARRPEGAADLPAPLLAYVDKVARWAYRVVDEDVDALRELGHDQHAIFELTLCAAFGASVAGLESVFAVLHGPG